MNEGLPVRFRNISNAHITDPGTKWGKCERDLESDADKTRLCNIGAKIERNDFLVWGDSQAESLAPAVNRSASRQKVSGSIIFKYGCPPLLDVPITEHCFGYNAAVIRYIAKHPELKTIILIARWAMYAEGSYYEPGLNAEAYGDENKTEAISFDLGLKRTVDTLTELDRTVVVVTQTPEIGYYVPAAYFTALRTGRDVNALIAPTLEEYQLRNHNVIRTINAIKQQKRNFFIIDISSALCRDNVCLAALNNEPLYRDDNHLSSYGSLSISYIFDPLFSGMSAADGGEQFITHHSP
jgi:hypothetical protein